MRKCTDAEGLALFKWYVREFGREPSARKLVTLCGYRSVSGAKQLLQRLAIQGLLVRVGPTPCRNKPYYKLPGQGRAVEVIPQGDLDCACNEGLL